MLLNLFLYIVFFSGWKRLDYFLPYFVLFMNEHTCDVYLIYFQLEVISENFLLIWIFL